MPVLRNTRTPRSFAVFPDSARSSAPGSSRSSGMTRPATPILSGPSHKYVAYLVLVLPVGLGEAYPPRGGCMPRRSPYAIELSDEDRAELQRTAGRYSSPYRDVMR